MQPLLSIDQLAVNFETEQGCSKALQGISFSINKGSITAIVGESGSGKSVTALSILKLLPQQTVRYPSGSILFSADGIQNLDLLKLGEKELRHIRGNKIGMIFQEPMSSLNPVFTCGNQVTEAIRLHQKISNTAAKQQTISLFQKVKLPHPESIYDRYPHQLSGGQKQRVMIAMAMSCSPELLICDEPTTALDVTVQKTMLQLIKELQQATHMGVIFITHDLGVVAEIADEVIVMYKGLIVEQGPAKTLLQQPQHPYTKSLLACRPSLHPKGARLPVVSDFMEIDAAGLIQAIEKTSYSFRTEIKFETAQTPSPENLMQENIFSEKLMEVKNLSVLFPGKRDFFGKPIEYTRAVDAISFDVYKGETLGLVGESGCGKTSLGRALLRLKEPSSGSIILNGTNLLQYNPQQLRAIRKDIQIVFQDPFSSLNPRITIGNAIQEVLQVHQMQSNRKEQKDKVMDLLEKVSLKPEHFNRYPHEFSGGQRQRIVIARALALNPYFIVCDESVSALDVSVQAQVLNLLNDLKKEFGFTVIFISHDLSVVHYISDRIMVMQKGKIVEIGTASQVYHHPVQPYTQNLIAAIPKAPGNQQNQQ
jgi:peptide/nickel transport system ATP-binding protein